MADAHADKRYKYLRGLWSRACAGSVATYRDKEFQHLCKALARISVVREALPNRHAVRSSVDGCGDQVIELLKELDEGRGSNEPPARGQFCGAAAALLVALLDETERHEDRGAQCKDTGVVGKLQLLDAASAISEQKFVASAACKRLQPAAPA